MNARRLIPWLAVALLCPVFVFQAMTPESTVAEAPEVVLPTSFPGYKSEEIRYCQNEQCGGVFPLSQLKADRPDVCPICGNAVAACSLGERTILPDDTKILKRIYQTPYGTKYLVSVVIGGKSKSSIHRPELCLPAQGFLMTNPRSFKVGSRPFRAIGLQRAQMAPSVLAYTFFNQNGVRTASHGHRILTDVWDRSVLNRIDRWVMVSVVASNDRGIDLRNPSDRTMVEGFLARLEKELP